MIKKIKYWLWEIGFYDNDCPFCHRPLMAHGFPPSERWTCQEGSILRECEFNDY